MGPLFIRLQRRLVAPAMAVLVVSVLGLVWVHGLPRPSATFGNVGGIAFIVPNTAEIAAAALHFLAWVAFGAAVRLGRSYALGATTAAVLYAAAGFMWVVLANQRPGQ